jgi:hypothetical protein
VVGPDEEVEACRVPAVLLDPVGDGHGRPVRVVEEDPRRLVEVVEIAALERRDRAGDPIDRRPDAPRPVGDGLAVVEVRDVDLHDVRAVGSREDGTSKTREPSVKANDT